MACTTFTECTEKFGPYITESNKDLVPFLREQDPDKRRWPTQLPPPLIRPGEHARPAVAGRVVTANEVERFLPVQAVVHSEPRGWAVVGVPANFWVEVAPVTVDGELFDTAVQVRFTPSGYRWDYGDGEVGRTGTAGASWAALGQDELTETPAGHLYAQRGRATVTARVAYTAEYRVGDGQWVAVQGDVVAPAPPLPMLLVTESTVLTAVP